MNVLLARGSTFSTFALLASLSHIIDLCDAVHHKHQMSILVRSLLALLLLDPLMQKVDPLVILFFQLSLDALILHILQPVHLELQLIFAYHLALTNVGRASLV